MDDTFAEAMKIIDARFKETGPWDEGDKEAFVFNDAVIMVSMNKGRKLQIDVVAGVPHKIDMNLELLEKVE